MPTRSRPDAQAELARDRNRLSADRSLLSFVRSSLTLIGLGVGLEQILRAIGAGDRAIDAWVYSLSLVCLGVGVLSLVLAIADYQTEHVQLRSPIYRYRPRWSIAEITGLAVFAIGAVALGWLGLDLLP